MLKRKSRSSKTGQIIQCKPIDTPFTFDLNTWEKYYKFAQKNNLIQQPIPPPTFQDSIISLYDSRKTILQNLTELEEHTYKKIIIFNQIEVEGVNIQLGNNSLVTYVNDEPIDQAEFLLDNQYIFSYAYNSIASNKILVEFDIDLYNFYIDVTVKPPYSAVNWYCNCDFNQNTFPFSISSVSPANKFNNGDYATWHIDYLHLENPSSILNQYCQICYAILSNPTFTNEKMTDYGNVVLNPSNYQQAIFFY